MLTARFCTALYWKGQHLRAGLWWPQGAGARGSALHFCPWPQGAAEQTSDGPYLHRRDLCFLIGWYCFVPSNPIPSLSRHLNSESINRLLSVATAVLSNGQRFRCCFQLQPEGRPEPQPRPRTGRRASERQRVWPAGRAARGRAPGEGAGAAQGPRAFPRPRGAVLPAPQAWRVPVSAAGAAPSALTPSGAGAGKGERGPRACVRRAGVRVAPLGAAPAGQGACGDGAGRPRPLRRERGGRPGVRAVPAGRGH